MAVPSKDPLQKKPKNKRRKRGLPALPSVKSRPNKAARTAPIEDAATFSAQEGPQYEFLATKADIAIYGGAAGGGKTFAALIEPLRHLGNSVFEAVIFRRTRPQIKQAGGLMVEAGKIYPLFGAVPSMTDLSWKFPGGMSVRFVGLQHEKSKLEFQGAQIPLIIFDELTHFSESQFFYMISRIRSNSGVPGYVRGTCNPDADSWVAEFISWWIDSETGLPIPERSGQLRYFVRDGDRMVWGSSHAELREQFPHWPDDAFQPKSVTFIAATIYDNKKLLENDPGYLGNLMSLPLVEREQLLGGNWKIKFAAGLMFKEHWFEIVTAVPGEVLDTVTAWDFAATKKTEANKKPDYTASVTIARCRRTKVFYILKANRFRGSELEVQTALINTAKQDGTGVGVRFPRDPGQAGKFQTHEFIKSLAGFDVRASREEGDKITRAKAASAQAEAQNIKVLKGPWVREFLSELAQFPDGDFDDFVDALSRGFNDLAKATMGSG